MLKVNVFAICTIIILRENVVGEQNTVTDSCNSRLNHNIYNEDYNEVMLQIKKAQSEYVPCIYNNCSCFIDVIEADLAPFKSGITKSMIDKIRVRGVKYQLINHHLYRDRECLFPARCEGIEYFINRIRYELRNFELIINIRDWPQLSKYHTGEPLPSFSFSKTQDYYDIMYPAWSFWDGGPAIKLYPHGLGQWNDHRKNLIQEAERTPWSRKQKKGFFRGSRTSIERDVLILLSRKNVSLVDAAYTKNQAWKSIKDTLGMPPAEELPLTEHCKYRYLFNFRGVAASFRLRHLFLCHSLVFHVGNEWREFFYDALKPWVHYIPIHHDAKEDAYRSLLEFFMEQDEVGFTIAKNGYNFIKAHLEIEDVLCYWKLLLNNYIKLQNFEPILDEKLIDVTK